MDARELLAVGPEGYTAARDAEVKRRRAQGDRAGANELKALGRPSLALWAVLAAADDAALVCAAVEATGELARAQRDAAGGGDAAAVGPATAARRAAVDAVRDRAVSRLAEATDRKRADGQRDEIRALVDRASRHPELLAAWIDGTLRDVPDGTGFDAFEDLADVIPIGRDRRRATAPVAEPPAGAPAGGREALERAQRERERERRRAKALAAYEAADREMTEAEVALAEAGMRRAEAARRLEEAREALDAVDDS